MPLTSPTASVDHTATSALSLPPVCSRFSLSADGQPSPVHPTDAAAFARIAWEKPVVITITRETSFTSVVVRPLSLGIRCELKGKTAEFTLTAPACLSVEFDDDLAYPFILFADLALPVPPHTAANLRVFGSGLHEIGELRPSDGETLYLSAGAWLRGNILVETRSGVRILGPGVIDAIGTRPGKSANPLLILDSHDMLVDGPILLNRGEWSCIIRRSRDVVIRNLKALGSEPCSDGIDVDGSTHVRVSDCFIKTNDDCLVIKSSPPAGGARVEDVEFTRCVLWNGPAGNGIDVGYETQTDLIRNITFRDLEIIHVECHAESGWIDRIAALALHITHDARVENVLFENITLEDVRTPKLIQVMTFHYYREHGWFSPPDRLARGTIRGLTFRNIHFLQSAAAPRIHVEGFNGPHDIADVLFENLTLAGEPLLQHPALVFEKVNTTGFVWR